MRDSIATVTRWHSCNGSCCLGMWCLLVPFNQSVHCSCCLFSHASLYYKCVFEFSSHPVFEINAILKLDLQ